MTEALFFAAGVLAGAAVALTIIALRRGRDVEFAQRLVSDSAETKDRELKIVIAELQATFSRLSRDALSANTDDFLKLAQTRLEKQSAMGEQTLEHKKKLIDARLDELNKKLGSLNTVIQAVEKDRGETHGQLKGQIERATQATMHLSETTAQLRAALSNPQRRGQWGERMAEDVLRLAGLVEGINYLKQVRIAEGTIPDFTFLLPNNQRVHMDVKFPLANYLKMLDAKDPDARAASNAQFLKDVRARIKEVTTRSYIAPADGTVDFVLVFIPNEQIYGHIHQHDSTLLDDALRQKVILCSPLSLYAIVAVIHESVSTFRLAQSSRQVLELLADFRKQWEKYVTCMEKMGDRLEAATKEFGQLVGVRTRGLDRQLDRIENLTLEEVGRIEDSGDDGVQRDTDESVSTAGPTKPDTGRQSA